MNSVLIDNQIRLKNILSSNTKLKDIKLIDEKLVYKGSSIDLNTINLNILFSNNYSKLVLDIKADNIYPENFFEIMQINSYKLEDEDKNNYDIINIEHFKKMLNNYSLLDEKEFKLFNNFQRYIRLLMLQTTSDDTYLNQIQKELLDHYIELMQNMLQNNNQNKASDNYLKIVENVNQEKTNRLKRSISLEKKDGFVNALFIIIMFVVTGIIVGCCGLFLIK